MNYSDMPKSTTSPFVGLLWYFLILFLGIFFGLMITGGVAVFVFDRDEMDMQRIMSNISEYPDYFQYVMGINALTLILSLFLPSVLFILIFKSKIENFNLDEKGGRYVLILIVLSGFLMMFASPLVGWLGEVNKMISLPKSFEYIERLAKQTDQQYEQMYVVIKGMSDFDDLLLLMVFIGVAPAIIEELVFRGIIQKLLVLSSGQQHLGVWVSALLFSLMHMSLYGFFPRLFLGAILGYIYLYSGRLVVPIFAHFVNNALAVLVLFYMPSKEESLENPSTCLVFTGTAVFVILAYYFINLSNNKLEIEDE